MSLSWVYPSKGFKPLEGCAIAMCARNWKMKLEFL